MQTIGFIVVGGKEIFLLKRQSRYRTSLKPRKGKSAGTHLSDEEAYLLDAPDLVSALMSGGTVYI